MHGGDVYRNKVQIDFSVNTNPLGVPASVLQAMQEAVLEADRYPDPTCMRLREALSSYYGITAEKIVCGNGASELILACMHSMAFQLQTQGKQGQSLPEKEETKENNTSNHLRALVPAPGFSGYRHTLEAVSAEIFSYHLQEKRDFAFDAEDVIQKIESYNPHLVIWTNPNNPTGTLALTEELCKVADICEQRGILFLVDECFLELTESEAVCSLLKKLDTYDNLVILRAVTKTFAIPGIRLGYFFASGERCKQIAAQLPEWNVSYVAQVAGCACFSMHVRRFLQESNQTIRQGKQQLEQGLSEVLTDLQLRIYPSSANYILFSVMEETGEKSLYEKLLEKGILIRNCQDYDLQEQVGNRHFYRIAVKKDMENRTLLDALTKI